jgi:hypothetical protein
MFPPGEVQLMTVTIQTTDINSASSPVFTVAAGDYFYQLAGVNLTTTSTSGGNPAILATGTGANTIEIHGTVFASAMGIAGAGSFINIASTGSVSSAFWGLVGQQTSAATNYEIDGSLYGGALGIEDQSTASLRYLHVGTTGTVTSQGTAVHIWNPVNAIIEGTVYGSAGGFSDIATSGTNQVTVSATGSVSGASAYGISFATAGSVSIDGRVAAGTNGIEDTATTGTTSITVGRSGFVTGANGINTSNAGAISVAGQVTGTSWGIITGISGGLSEVDIFTGGIVKGGTGGGIQIHGPHIVSNAGAISARGSVGLSADGAGILVNTGTIEDGVVGVRYADLTAIDLLTTVNTGTISGAPSAFSSAATSYDATTNAASEHFTNQGTLIGDVRLGSHAASYFVNAGTLVGGVILGNGQGQLADSTFGTISAAITCGTGGDTVIAGQNGGKVTGGAGDDILYANPTQAAADNRAQTTLDGGAGTNALYGGGGFNTFIVGNTNGGYNQVWGGASAMTGVSGYTNNTLSFANAPAGVFVDLLNGHNAYVGSTVGGAWAGTGTYEDSIVNVPSVIGSAFGDVIQADNGTGRIQGGAGADALYAGSGASSQDTFVYAAYADSNTINGYDTIVGFKLGEDKIDLSALHTDGSHLAISTAGTSNTLYVEVTPGTFNAATDLAMIVNTTTAGGLHASDFVF